MFAKHLARIDNKTFSFSIWNIEKMLPTKLVVGGRTRINRMYNKCAFGEIDLTELGIRLETDLAKEQHKSSVTTSPLTKRRKDVGIKKLLSRDKLVEFLSEH